MTRGNAFVHLGQRAADVVVGLEVGRPRLVFTAEEDRRSVDVRGAGGAVIGPVDTRDAGNGQRTQTPAQPASYYSDGWHWYVMTKDNATNYQAIFRDGQYWDEIHMSILLDEWEARNRG